MNPVLSMTGFATIQSAVPSGRIFSLTLKGVNHRHLDLQIRLPGGVDALEPHLRNAIKEGIHRGHVELTLSLEKTAATAIVELDESLLNAYVNAFNRASARLDTKQPLDINGLLRMPGVMSANIPPLDLAELEAPALAAMQQLLTLFNEARAAEGAALAADLRALMQSLAALAAEARTLREGMAEIEFARLKAKLDELLDTTGINPELLESRLVSEAALIAARGDVEEELVRLRTHIDRFIDLLDAGGEVGRQLDFLLQEMNREANTLLSKTGGSTSGLRLTDVGLEIKVNLERAREQVQNLE
jgi:uncharacterized protein (TIGR00255 family)